jgi:hypothetical protein
LRVAVSHKDLADLVGAGQAHWFQVTGNAFFGKFPKIRNGECGAILGNGSALAAAPAPNPR